MKASVRVETHISAAGRTFPRRREDWDDSRSLPGVWYLSVPDPLQTSHQLASLITHFLAGEESRSAYNERMLASYIKAKRHKKMKTRRSSVMINGDTSALCDYFIAKGKKKNLLSTN